MLNQNPRTDSHNHKLVFTLCMCVCVKSWRLHLNSIETSKKSSRQFALSSVLLACSFFHTSWKLNEAFSFNELSLWLLLLVVCFINPLHLHLHIAARPLRLHRHTTACGNLRQTIERKLIGYKLYRMPHYSMIFSFSPSLVEMASIWPAIDPRHP